ncbi:GntR family transcriptional regulator [Myceligenerans halotolerans]
MPPRRTPATEPGYLRIADDVRIQIETGVLAPGDDVPSLAELQRSYKVSQAVARQAIASLRSQGLISGGQGKRATVRAPRIRVTRSNRQHHEEKRRVHLPEDERRNHGPLEDTTGLSLHNDGVTLHATYSEVTADRRNPEFAEGTPLLRREYETVNADGRRLAWSASWIPLDLARKNPALLDESNEPWPGAIQHQLHTVGVEVGEVTDTITARPPTTVEVEQWGMAPGEPLLEGRDVMRDIDGRIVATSYSQYPADSTAMEFVTPLERHRR